MPVPAAKDAALVAAAVDVPRLRLTLAGIAEDPAPDGGSPVRTAIIAGNGQLFLAKNGDTVTDQRTSNTGWETFPLTALSSPIFVTAASDD